MAVLLPLLAALQYYWLGQVSEGASERLHSSLRTSATGFRRDFNREFIRAYLNFQIDSFATPLDREGIERYHLDHFEQWNQTAPYPQLISDLFLVNYDQGLPRLSYLNAQTKRFELTEWSGELLPLRDRFERRDEVSTRSVDTSSQPLESFAEDIPALIVPFPVGQTQNPKIHAVSQTGQPLGTTLGTTKNPPLPPGFTIIKLDLSYIQREFIPSLLQSHVFDEPYSKYNVAIVSLNHPERVIYSSHYPLVDVGSPDVSTRIFGLEADELRSFVGSQDASSRASAGGAQPMARRLTNLRFLKRPAVNATTSASEDDGRWQLLIKHQTGSLAAAVSSARRRNLAISFGILLLLGAGILMTAISTRRAERLARQQINFVAGVTHELRTPLAVICSAGENLADGIVDTPEKAAQYGQVIYREGRRLTDMVEQVLEFAGAQSGRPRYELRPTDVAACIAGAVATCQAQIQERNFNIETSIAPNVPPVHGDAAALRRALQNLISNAIKYDGENRWARISAQTSPGEQGRQGNEVRITVEDRGRGIDAAEIPHIFEPFYRGHEAVAAQIEGSGVGLSLVKQIVEAHGGRVRVRSVQGAGSVFTLYLPIAESDRRIKV